MRATPAAFEPLYASWWLADTPDDKVVGTLAQDEQGQFTLTLNGILGRALTETEDWPGLLPGEHRIIGANDIGAGAALEGCIVRKIDAPPMLPRQVWHVGEIVMDAGFEAEEPWAFYGVRYRVPLLTRFTQRQTVAVEVARDDSQRPTAVTYAVDIKTWSLWTRDGFEVSLGSGVHRTENGETHLDIESRVDLCVHTSKAVERAHFLRIALRPVQVLIGLASGHFTAPAGAEVLLEPYKAEGGNQHLPLYFRPLEVTLPARLPTYGFQYAELAGLGTERIQAWLSRLALLEPVTDLYVALLHDQGYAETAFLLAVQALETYHRRTSFETLVPVTAWEGVRKAIATLIETSLPESDGRSALIGRLGFQNEISLAERLDGLLESLGPTHTEICGSDRKRFVSTVVRTRNYFTHWDPKGERRAVRDARLVHLTSRLVGFLELLMLADLGFASDSRAGQAILDRRIRWLPSEEDSDA